eukprot:13233788-Ditylum_brightwellii.AAC.1
MVFSASPASLEVSVPRAFATASISSTKMMHGAHARACWNRLRTRAAPTPTNISEKSLPASAKKGTLPCVAT